MRYGANVASISRALDDEAVEAVVIASSTDTHVELIEQAARRGKHIFCEKPIDLSVPRVEEAIKSVNRAGVRLFVGFNRRFDRSFAALKSQLQRLGRIEMILVNSRDPEPPPASYVRRSGGLFKDMMIHDFDMVRWLLQEEPIEVFASASNLFSDDIKAAQDVDTAMVTLRTASGVLCQITNSRRAAYGYDQRLEVFGERGMLQANNPLKSTVVLTDANGAQTDRLPSFFIDRYADAYREEMGCFLEGVAGGDSGPLAEPEDGRRALLLAVAANRSLEERRIVKLQEHD